jgi:hypothetical protein
MAHGVHIQCYGVHICIYQYLASGGHNGTWCAYAMLCIYVHKSVAYESDSDSEHVTPSTLCLVHSGPAAVRHGHGDTVILVLGADARVSNHVLGLGLARMERGSALGRGT